MRIEAGSPVGQAVLRGRRCFASGDVRGGDEAYRQAVRSAGADARLGSELREDHVTRLMACREFGLAAARCEEYVNGARPGPVPLRVLRAEIHSAVGDHRRAAAEAEAVRTAGAGPLSPEEDARLHRVQGLAAADLDDHGLAGLHLLKARSLLDDPERAARIDDDLRHLAARADHDAAADEAVRHALSGDPPETVAEHLRLATDLRRQARYQEAIAVLIRCLARSEIAPGFRWPVMHELAQLVRAVGQGRAFERLRPLVEDAAREWAEPAEASEEAARLFGAESPGEVRSTRFTVRIAHARAFIGDERLDQAERLLVELRDRASTPREVSLWHLAAGELEFTRSLTAFGGNSFLDDALGHLARAVQHASAVSLADVRIRALRLLGRAFAEVGTAAADDRCVECWAEAHRLEEQHIAARQVTDRLRVEMLHTVLDEHDERVRVADQAVDAHGGERAAVLAVAMEAARGAAILGRILPGGAEAVRDLPGPSDVRGAWRWLKGITADLPRTRAAWLIHCTPDHVHHAVVGRGLLVQARVACDRRELAAAVEALSACWADESLLELLVASGDFDEQLARVTAMIRPAAVLDALPPRVRRIALVSGGVLADVPFGAMRPGGEGEPLGLRFALSDLPCLSARLPLHLRSRRLRGDERHLIRPPGEGLPGRGGDATPAGVRAAFAANRYRLVRIDAHGEYGHRDADDSYLRLMPEGPDGHLRARDLRDMDLGGCGTLVLGACESGMAGRVGRDERLGFVRAGLTAGAASVIAARWKAPAVVAMPLLDRFEAYLRHLPRDVALQRAQRDFCEGALGVPEDLRLPGHPARWACWTLYGDAGLQTGAGLVRRKLREIAMRGDDG
ncbi:hypothetical protein GCM10010191_74560 [Actinomadura vinacea]|uniref:CHAT domain-containing protein n=1 Tax=Actinomadura vinacea TaxID=115336 RepID=A0ABN3K570_9ACTN